MNLYPAPLFYQGSTPSAQKRRVACLTFSRSSEGIAKRHCKNMIRRHATWMGIHPRSATFVSSLCFFFGEVFTRAYDTLLRTLLGPFGLAQLLGSGRSARSASAPYHFGHAGRVTLPLFRGSGRSSVICKVQAPSRDAHFALYILHFTLSRPGGGYSVPLLAALPRHEKPYPPMSKINLAFPFTVPSKGNAGKYTPFPRPPQAGFWEIEVLRAICDVNARYVTYEADAPLAFAAGRFGVLEIGGKLQKRLQNSKSPHLQAANAIHVTLPFEGFDTGSIATGEVAGMGVRLLNNL